jgi:endo-1,4-beta-xylanase
MSRTFQFLVVLAISFSAFSCGGDANQVTHNNNASSSEPQTIASAYKEHFIIGAAVNRKQMMGDDSHSLAIIDDNFSGLTPENDMKWESIQPQEGIFTFEGADALMTYADQSDKAVIGHVLVWHEQTPDWVFEDESGNPASRKLLLERMETHINALAGRYKDRIEGWDVVNEALNEDGSMRESKWYALLGPDFIEKAFIFAAAAAPKAKLYYNDYNLYKANKMDGALRIVSSLRAKGIRIDGIGEQGHYGIQPPVEQLEATIQKAIKANIDLMITELDISVLPFPSEDNMGADISLNFELQDKYNPFKDGQSEESKIQLAKAYTDLFTLFLKYHDAISRVTLWGVSDNDTWRNYWPIRGRTDYPLLFDYDYQPKPFIKELILLAESN